MTEIEKDELASRLTTTRSRSSTSARPSSTPATSARRAIRARGASRARCTCRSTSWSSCRRAELRERLGLPEGAEIAAYCHSGSRSAIAVQILRAAGYDARNYPGSWHEWSRDESLPAETG